MTEFTQEVTPEEAINIILNTKLLQTSISMPGIITDYDKNTQLAKVQPVFKQVSLDKDGNEIIEDLPIINKVPVFFPQNKNFFIHISPEKGDPCYLIFSDRSMDSYKASSGKTTIDPIESRAHNLNDCIALVGIGTEKTKIDNVDENAIMLAKKDGSAQFKITNGNEVTFKGTAARFGEHTANKALALAEKTNNSIDEIRTAINSHTHVGNLGAPIVGTFPASTFFSPPVDSNTVFSKG